MAEQEDINSLKSYGLSEDVSKKIIDALQNKDKKQVLKLLSEVHAADIADFLEVISPDQRHDIIEILRSDFNPEILVEVQSFVKSDILEILGVEESAKALTSLDTDDAVEVMEDLNIQDQEEILKAIPKEQRLELETGLSYPDDSAGRLVDKRFICIPEFWNVGQTIDFLRQTEELPDEYYEIFIVNPKHVPVGTVMLSRILHSKRDVMLSDIMRENLHLIPSTMDQEEVAFIFRQYALVTAPVVNDENRMIGVIKVDDVVDVMEEEAQEDIMHLGGIKEADLHASYIDTVKARFPWLLINLATAIAASIVISFFEHNIAKLASLAVLMPIIASMGGNAGTQTLTIAVRAIATKELTTTNAMRVIKKEILVGSLNGIAFAIIMGLLSYFWYNNFTLSLTLSVSTVITLLLSGFSGAVIPLALEKFGVDPAISSSVFLTTVTDIIAFGSFLGFAAYMIL